MALAELRLPPHGGSGGAKRRYATSNTSLRAQRRSAALRAKQRHQRHLPPLAALPAALVAALPADVAAALDGVVTSAGSQTPGLLTGAIINVLVYVLGIKVLRKGLTWEGVLSSWFLGTLVFAAFGARGYAIVCSYFLLGTLVTKVRMKQKEAEGIAEARSGRRSLGSVVGSGFAGIICALAALLTGNVALWRVGFVASFASKMADTTSSEIGKAYGQTTYLVTTFHRVKRGTEGAVSLEGTAAGLAAAGLVGLLAYALNQVDGLDALCVIVAAFIANLLESYIGALEQGKVSWLTNDVVNVIQICIAAGLAMGGRLVLG